MKRHGSLAVLAGVLAFAVVLAGCSGQAGRAPAAAAKAKESQRVFYESSEEGRKIVYVLDRSGSMTDWFDMVKCELKRSVSELKEQDQFLIIFYSSGAPLEMPPQGMATATDRAKQSAWEFIDRVVAEGEADPSEALERAFACRPDLVYLLTDGEFDKEIVNQVRRLNFDRRATVYTIAFLNNAGEAVLKQIAQENHGAYRFVSEKDLQTLGQ